MRRRTPALWRGIWRRDILRRVRFGAWGHAYPAVVGADAEVLGGERTVRRWCDSGPRGPAEILLRLLEDGRIKIAHLRGAPNAAQRRADGSGAHHLTSN